MGIHFRVPPGLEIVDSDRSYDWGPSSCDEDTAVEWEWSGVSAGYSKSVEVEVKAVSSGAQEIKSPVMAAWTIQSKILPVLPIVTLSPCLKSNIG
jgi:hypothetical protein